MRLRFTPSPPPGGPAPDVTHVVLDMAWTPPPGTPASVVALRDVVVDVLGAHDLYAEAMASLDGWAAAAGVDGAMTVDGISFWPSRRLGMWWAAHDWSLWVHVIDTLRRAHPGDVLDVADCDEPALVDAARAVAARDGLEVLVPATPPASADAIAAGPADPHGPIPAAGSARQPVVRSLLHRVRTYRDGRRWKARQRALQAAIAGPAGSGQRPVVLFLQHVKVEVQADGRSSWMDPYLGPVRGALERAGIPALAVLRDVAVEDEAAWRGAPGTLPGRILGPRYRRPGDRESAAGTAEAVAATIATDASPLAIAGADLGPAARAMLAHDVATVLPARLETRARVARLLREVRAGALVLAYEYGRPDWIGAARDAGVPVAAVQHGAITPWHPGYVLAARTAATPLADRTLVYGRWERDVLLERSVYRPDEVVVTGAPRLDMVPQASAAEREAARRELGVRDGERVVVHSTSWGRQIQRLYTPAALAAIIDRPLPRVHLVIKLHPSERPEQGDEYRRLVEDVARAGGFEPPRVSVVGRADLFRVLRAADAHLGLYSTVLTDAVAAGTPNLVITSFATRDLLDYVEAGVGIPVRDGGELLAALDAIAAGGGPTAQAQARFVEAHFEPGVASERVVEAVRPWVEVAAPGTTSSGGTADTGQTAKGRVPR